MADEWTIEIAQLPIIATAGSHVFWVLRDPTGTVVREIQGFPTDTAGLSQTVGGPLNPNDRIFMHDLSRADLLLPAHFDVFRPDLYPGGRFMSEWTGADITFATAFTGSEADIMERWGRVGPATEILNRLGLDYGPLAALDNYNSNSVARYAGELMGLDAEPPNLVSGNPANAVGWNKELMDRIVTALVVQINARQEDLGRSLTDAELQPYLDFIRQVTDAYEGCFAAGTLITMADGSQKPIEEIVAGDDVLSYDRTGALVPGRVTRTMTHTVRHLLDVFGLKVTPGHVTLCGDGVFAGRHVPIIDILRSDGALVREDGSLVRACTGCDVGAPGDAYIQAVTGDMLPDGRIEIRDSRKIRVGTRVLLDDGSDISLADVIAAGDGRITDEGLVAGPDCPEGAPFHWTYSERLPDPESYVLQRSRVLLSEIYAAGEWEDMRPIMRAPSPVGASLSERILAAEQSDGPSLHAAPAPKPARHRRRADRATARKAAPRRALH
ncbi:MAG: Hint domain-containing protein [Rhodobacter sp.]|nr:Hint domain-containing protein [Rhodobacter sp.]